MFSQSLQRITMLTPELAQVFARLDRIQPPKNNSKSASRALYHFMLSKVDDSLSAILQAFTEERKVVDGPSAYLKLRSTCAPQDSSSRHQAATNFFALRIAESEPLQMFNTRFNNHYKLVQASGSLLDPSEVIDHYLRAVQPIENPILQVRIQMFRQQRVFEMQTSEVILSPLTIIQSELQREEELAYDLLDDSEQNQSENDDDSSVTSVTPTIDSSTFEEVPPDAKCYGCGLPGHYIRHCPTTSATDCDQLVNTAVRDHSVNFVQTQREYRSVFAARKTRLVFRTNRVLWFMRTK